MWYATYINQTVIEVSASPQIPFGMVSLPRLMGNPRLSREGTAAPRLREYTAPPDGELIWSRTGKAQLDKDRVNVLDAQKRRRMFCLLFFALSENRADIWAGRPPAADRGAHNQTQLEKMLWKPYLFCFFA